MSDKSQLHHIKEIVRLVEEQRLSELEVGAGDLWVRVVGEVSPTGLAFQPTPELSQQVLTTPARAESAPERVSEEQSLAAGRPLESPMDGVFYGSPSPGADPYVAVGDFVEKGQVVCLIEAMKTFNEVVSECSGTVVAILVENGQQVSQGDVLMIVKPEGEPE